MIPVSFLISIILPIAVYLFVQIILLMTINRFFLGNKLKFREIINIAIISGLLVTLTWIIISLVLLYILGVFGMFIGISGCALLGPVIAMFFTFLIFKNSIALYVKNISIKTARNLCIFMMLFNIFLIFFFLVLVKNITVRF